MLLIGKYNHSIDEKGRLILPSKLREKLGGTVYCTLGFDGCIALYSEETFLAINEKLSRISFLVKDERDYKRTFCSNSSECEIDKQGRISLVKEIMNKVGIKKDVVIIGSGDHVEIWDSLKYAEEEKRNDENFEANASQVNQTLLINK